MPGLLRGLTALALGALLGASCGPPPGASCRFNPFCSNGDIGAFCEHDGQCKNAYCCESDDCNGGMCSLPCDKKTPCPAGLNCHGGHCLYDCGNDADCADGAECKGGNCRWD